MSDKELRNVPIPCELYTKFAGRANMVHFLKNAPDQIEKLEAQLKEAIEVIRYYKIEACNEDWCERYLPEHDKEVIEYLTGKKATEFLEKYGLE